MAHERPARLIELPRAPEAIELRHLRAFVAVAEELNFSRAAERLFLSQPALSRQISSLERLLRVQVLRRNTQRVELTLAGEALLSRSRSMLADLDDAVVTTRSIGGEVDERVTQLTRPLAEAANDLDEFRAANEALNAQFPVPAEIGMRPVTAGGVPSLVFGRDGGAGRPTVLLAHGGGYVVGSAYGTRPLAGALAAAAGASVLVPDYRLAPEHRYPAAVDDALAAYRWLLERADSPADVALVGESSGGGLAMSVLLRLKAAGEPLPGRVVLLCPWVDLACRYLRDDTVHPEQDGIAQLARINAERYLDGHPPGDPLLDPLGVDLSGLPAMLVQVATGDFVLHESRLLVERARAAGVDARLALYPVATHVFHIYWSFLPEAALALEQAGAFIVGAAEPDSAAETYERPA
ncbi:alpha/beta hydrolase fold domain-containing protein [Jiangella asiatica]|uniref:LysR family transcriptional regulator n=1 Tax=Jiangella asiatica TaxID=2530372 RepID=A0A4R5CP47_9ACTN|nr:alpha/beta hydrolase fold domain-containing protein [Jiangella asiatica]TDE02209.1 LysR family transcriptional regulator [Jiangella asiatica]